LEDDMGGPLFDRVGWRCELTLLGRHVLEQARLLSAGADDLAESARLMSAGVAGKVPIGLGSGPGAMLMTPLLLHMATQQPRLCLDITRGTTEALIEALRDRRLEAVVIESRSVPPSIDLRSETLCEMKAAFMCRPGHPLLKRRGSITIDEVRMYPVACTPLSDEVAAVLVDRYGPRAHPDRLVTLRV
jgi:DNA-binding transcriptional LysR family regulator